MLGLPPTSLFCFFSSFFQLVFSARTDNSINVIWKHGNAFAAIIVHLAPTNNSEILLLRRERRPPSPFGRGAPKGRRGPSSLFLPRRGGNLPPQMLDMLRTEIFCCIPRRAAAYRRSKVRLRRQISAIYAEAAAAAFPLRRPHLSSPFGRG